MVTIKDFAKLLNVELGEEFLLADEDGRYAPRYRFTKNGVEYLSLDGWKKYSLDINSIIDKNIIKKPWKPNIDEVYLYIDKPIMFLGLNGEMIFVILNDMLLEIYFRQQKRLIKIKKYY